MFQIEITDRFRKWFAGLRDPNARARVNVRLHRLRLGNAGDVRAVGQGVSELKVDYGPGYRVYFMRKGKQVILLLAGGDKKSQFRDIRLAIEMAAAERSGE